MTHPTERRAPVPPFTQQTAIEKVRKAEDAWNSRDPAKVSLAYTTDSRWRNRSEFLQGRAAIVEIPHPQVAAGTRLQAHQGAVGLYRRPHRVRFA